MAIQGAISLLVHGWSVYKDMYMYMRVVCVLDTAEVE